MNRRELISKIFFTWAAATITLVAFYVAMRWLK